MRGETFDERRARCDAQDEKGNALGDARWERGQRLTEDERRALDRSCMWGAADYPIRKLGRGWSIESPFAQGFGIMRTKAEAVGRWETLLACWRRLAGLQAQERALAEIAGAE